MDKILVVEDEISSANLLKVALAKNGFKVFHAHSAEEALLKIREAMPDLILLDWQLPGMSGIKLCQLLKDDAYTTQLPIIMLTSQKEEPSKIEGLEKGADDYVTKPFSPKELVARIHALLRRVQKAGQPGSRILASGKLTVDLDAHRAALAGKPLALRPKEFDLLVLFLEKRDRVLTYTFLAESVWGDDRSATRQDVRWWVSELRERLGKMGACIQTVTNQGYRFSDL